MGTPKASACDSKVACDNFSERKTSWKRLITVQNVLMLIVALFQLGTFWERQQTTNGSLAAQITQVAHEVRNLRTDLDRTSNETDQTYARKDVISIQLAAIEGRLYVIEGMVRDELRPMGRPARTMDR